MGNLCTLRLVIGIGGFYSFWWLLIREEWLLSCRLLRWVDYCIPFPLEYTKERGSSCELTILVDFFLERIRRLTAYGGRCISGTACRITWWAAFSAILSGDKPSPVKVAEGLTSVVLFSWNVLSLYGVGWSIGRSIDFSNFEIVIESGSLYILSALSIDFLARCLAAD